MLGNEGSFFSPYDRRTQEIDSPSIDSNKNAMNRSIEDIHRMLQAYRSFEVIFLRPISIL